MPPASSRKTRSKLQTARSHEKSFEALSSCPREGKGSQHGNTGRNRASAMKGGECTALRASRLVGHPGASITRIEGGDAWNDVPTRPASSGSVVFEESS